MTDTQGTASTVTAQAAGALPFGRFAFDVAAGKLAWSDPLYRIYGFTPGDVVPTLALMSRHAHPEDRERWDAAVAAALGAGTTFCVWHRILDVRTKVRTVLTVGSAIHGTGGVTQLSGYIADLTANLRRNREQETNRAVLDAAATRDLIEQAKGMMMVIFDLTEAQAFDLLRWHSSHNNVKVRDVAATLVERLVDPELAGTRPRERLTAILAGLRSAGAAARPPLPAPVDASLPVADGQPGGTPSARRRIANADLPRTLMRAVSAAAVSITIADWQAPDQPLVYVNDAFAALTGYTSDDILGRNCRFLQGPDSGQRAVREMRRALDAGRDIRSVLRNYRKDGTPFWNEVHLSAVRDDAGRITHYIGYQSDVSERVEREEQLYRLAYRDAGTDLPNAAAGIADLEAAVGEARDAGFDLVCVYTEDGSAAGLRSAAQQLSGLLPADACLSVRADQGFLIRTPTGADRGDELVTAIRAVFAGPDPADRSGAAATLRIGSVHFPGDGADAASLVAAAVRAAQDRTTGRTRPEPITQEDA